MSLLSDTLVLLDASVLEGSYLGPMLRGDSCRDVRAIHDHGYTPAVLRKVLNEIWMHAKVGGGNVARWTAADPNYPGPIDRMISLLEKANLNGGAQRTAWFWFNLAEEWDPDSTIGFSQEQREFLTWKRAMAAFCERIETALKMQGVPIVSPESVQCVLRPQEIVIAERELALHSLLPTEDAAWILDALVMGVRAVVTRDTGVLERGRYSLGLNPTPAIVHPSRLREALEDDFSSATYPMLPAA